MANHSAIGCPINELPITPEKILRAIKAKGNALAE
jgi:CO/xanthine dehydrogenase Mo-binding subunit